MNQVIKEQETPFPHHLLLGIILSENAKKGLITNLDSENGARTISFANSVSGVNILSYKSVLVVGIEPWKVSE